MSILNKKELRKRIREGKGINIEDFLDEFKGMLKESISNSYRSRTNRPFRLL